MMDIHLFKVISFVSIFLTGLLGGGLAVWLAASSRSERFFSLGSAFAGGIFLGAGLIHMLPDAREGFQAAVPGYAFPWVALICACGFLLVLFLERVVLRGHHSVEKSVGRENEISLYPYVIVVVLSLHSVIAGIALGTEQRVVQALVILIAILAHKGSAAFALGVSLQRGGVSRGRVMHIVCFFSLMTPFGILMGSGLTALLTGRTEQFTASVFDALAAGTFLYVAVVDIIGEEFAGPKDRLFKFILLTFGLGFMAVLAIGT